MVESQLRQRAQFLPLSKQVLTLPEKIHLDSGLPQAQLGMKIPNSATSQLKEYGDKQAFSCAFLKMLRR